MRPPNRSGAPGAGMPGMQNQAQGGQILVNRPPSAIGDVPGAASSMKGAGAAGATGKNAPTIVRPATSLTNPTGTVQIFHTIGVSAVAIPGAQVGRWQTGDPGVARVVRITASATWAQAPTDIENKSYGVGLFVQWGSQSGATQSGWFPCPCDFEVTATFVQVSASLCAMPLAVPPKGFTGLATGQLHIADVSCSIAEGHSDGVTGFMLSPAGASINAAGSNPILTNPGNVVVRDLIVQNTSGNDTFVALMDLAPDIAAGDFGSLVMTPIRVPKTSTVPIAFDNLAIFNAPWIAAFTTAAGTVLDTTNASSVFYELRGWAPTFQGG